MTRVYQTRSNCWSAALASILDLSLDEVDHCSMEHDDAPATTQTFLAKHGLFYIEFSLDQGKDRQQFPFTAPPEGSLVIAVDNTHPLEHAVVARAGRLDGDLAFYVIHDPNRRDGSLALSYNIIRIIFLCRLLK